MLCNISFIAVSSSFLWAQNERLSFSCAQNERWGFPWALAWAPFTIWKKSASMSAAHDFRKERRVSGAHENDERTKGLPKYLCN